ncbi:hypothetical protein BO78DRAFT_237293 [Aspergillus sclerotiicarbonarius CBS 121057]|uniref:Uncharacterized protein n=1 Tax=Aspergillus sclerotiicarbonarius (strain CBS 121057 / IBT 28362) TaxID=1448318 RepID=A0A319EYW1_ASPSB|nr:hypothetical protein BO78DRAFT_237293 [Aspergillus sclerotiicarbonarius CBS 121057]
MDWCWTPLHMPGSNWGGKNKNEKEKGKGKRKRRKETQRACKEPDSALPHAISAQQPRIAQVARQGRNWPLEMQRNRVTDRVSRWCQTYDVRKDKGDPRFRILRVLPHPLIGGSVLFLTHGNVFNQWASTGPSALDAANVEGSTANGAEWAWTAAARRARRSPRAPGFLHSSSSEALTMMVPWVFTRTAAMALEPKSQTGDGDQGARRARN